MTFAIVKTLEIDSLSLANHVFVGAGDRTVALFDMTATQGHEKLSVKMCEVLRWEDGIIAERWGSGGTEELQERAHLIDASARCLQRAKVPLDHLLVVALERRVEEALLAAELGVEAVAIYAEPLHEHLC